MGSHSPKAKYITHHFAMLKRPSFTDTSHEGVDLAASMKNLAPLRRCFSVAGLCKWAVQDASGCRSLSERVGRHGALTPAA
jgi:hypothetical protein